MLVAAELGVQRGVFAPDDRDALATLIMKMGPLPPIADLPSAQIVEAVGRDKKVVGGQLHYVLPTAIGATAIVTDVTPEELTAALIATGLRS
jgi:3-dehydroquinate synthase